MRVCQTLIDVSSQHALICSILHNVEVGAFILPTLHGRQRRHREGGRVVLFAQVTRQVPTQVPELSQCPVGRTKYTVANPLVPLISSAGVPRKGGLIRMDCYLTLIN